MSFSSFIKKNIQTLEPWQEEALVHLDNLTKNYFFSPYLSGLYLYGPPGRGKTFLINHVAQYLPEKTVRFHFFSLCAVLQEYSHEKQDHQFELFIKDYCHRKILLLDEVLIEDIADAMIFARLFKVLIEKKIQCLMTSNIAIDNLYLGGLKRDAFLPTIAFMKNYLVSYKLDSHVDLRKNHQQTHKVFFPPEKKDELLSFIPTPDLEKSLSLGTSRQLQILAQNQDQKILALSSEVLFSYQAGKFDYKYITLNFRTLLLFDLDKFCWTDKSWCTRMVAFIDFCFDHQTKIFFHGLSSYGELQACLGHVIWPDRTLSRLHQISSENWARD